MKKWYEPAVFYHIYPLGLLDAPRENKEESVTNRMGELDQWIPHIRDIGCNAIYIGPLFESVAHGYETTDYKLVDRRLGDNRSFKEFIEKCHSQGIKVVVDGVFNHVGRKFFAFEDVIVNRENSRYKDWFCGINFGANNEYNDGFTYESWRGYIDLVKLNQKNTEVKNYIFEVIEFWVQEFNIDGIRLDCADVLDFDFMREMRSFCNAVKEDFWLMGEVIHGDYSRWVNEQMLHSVTNYEMHKGLYSSHNDHNYFEIAHTVKRLFGDNNADISKARLYTFVDNHDVERLVSKLHNKEHVYPAYILNYTLPGIPSIYYGSEFAVEGVKDNGQDYNLRPAINLSEYRDTSKGMDNIGVNTYKKGNIKLLTLIEQLGKMKRENEELSYGTYKELVLTNRQYSFARILEGTAMITAVNNDDVQVNIKIPIPVMASTAIDMISGETFVVSNAMLEVMLPANGGKILRIGL